MEILIVGDEGQKEEFLSGVNDISHLIFEADLPSENDYKKYEAYFILLKINSPVNFDLFENKPVFINEVINTSSSLNYPKNIVRINGWPGFIQRKTWEVFSKDIIDSEAIATKIDRKIIGVKDEPGLVAARVISMIINEAFFAIEEKISSRGEIDMAMKLGTNYPFGPFEWAEKIGISNIYTLLEALSKNDPRYFPSNELKKEFLEKKISK